ncbi:hypothetical protein BX661DRAFT_170399 [Kickxella alabastrina]|uniref:uncharacterized protein n=1 Tax=Kickxella alabastrina TaxID=61397 RepID=UPI002220C7EE|nr:uncharacterized protein BX661DRAFT_170399 [Kickxella alabastrina]KAI7830066.1 hypothetical protein BX661DRAFT_170399 [Kickxella alabastrina]
MSHSHPVHAPRRSNSIVSIPKTDSVASFSSRAPNNNHHHNNANIAPRKDNGRRNQPQKQHKQGNRGKQNNSDQRTNTEDIKSEDESQVVSKRPGKGNAARNNNNKQQAKVVILNRNAPLSEQQALLDKLAMPTPPSSAPPVVQNVRTPSKRGNRRRNNSPPHEDEAIISSYSMPSMPAPALAAAQRTPPRRPNNNNNNNRQQQQMLAGINLNLSTIYSPTPRGGANQGMPTGGPMASTPTRGGGSPSTKSNHYAGASFNNSPAPNTLPLPSSFRSPTSGLNPVSPSSPSAVVGGTRDEDVFGMGSPMFINSGPMSPDQLLAQQHRYAHYQRQQQQAVSMFPVHGNVNVALSERSRQLESMLLGGDAFGHGGGMQQMGAFYESHSAVDLTQPETDMASMFQKLRLIKEMSQNRSSTVSPLPSNRAPAFAQQQQQQLTAVHYA